MSMSKIEKDTRANAAKVNERTGVIPGRRSPGQAVANDQLSAAASADPSAGGRWSGVQPTPVVPVFQVVLPNGKVLMWDSVGDSETKTQLTQTFTRAAVWDPTQDTFRQVNVSGYNIFCAGFTQLADGRVLVAGGNKNPAYDGIVQTHLFDWRTETWSRGPDMQAARWYPVGRRTRQWRGAHRRWRAFATAEVYQRQRRVAPADWLLQLRSTHPIRSWCRVRTGRSSSSVRTSAWRR